MACSVALGLHRVADIDLDLVVDPRTPDRLVLFVAAAIPAIRLGAFT